MMFPYAIAVNGGCDSDPFSLCESIISEDYFVLSIWLVKIMGLNP